MSLLSCWNLTLVNGSSLGEQKTMDEQTEGLPIRCVFSSISPFTNLLDTEMKGGPRHLCCFASVKIRSHKNVENCWL